MKHLKKLVCTVLAIAMLSSAFSAMACTVIAVGKDASADGSVMVTHSCDGWYDHRIQVVPGGKHAEGEMVDIYRDPCQATLEEPTKVGEIPQVPETYTYFNIAYPFMNEKGLAVGEHTWSGREDMYNGNGLFVIANLEMLGLQRAATAREMVEVIGALAEEYGYGDWGESILIADKNEVWVFEICGPGITWTKDSGKPGAHWAARRVPDDQIYTAANRSRTGVIDFNDPDNYMWSTDITELPKQMGWWKEGEPFNYSMVFEANTSDDPGYMCSRREWRVFDLLAPSQELPILDDATANAYPWSVVPDEKVTLQDLMAVYYDHYEGTPYDMTTDAAAGPFHNPVRWRMKGSQKPEEMKPYNWERSIAIYRCSYSFVAQCRDWLPEEIGTCLWYGADSPDTTCHVPIYAGTTEVPVEWSTGDRFKFDPNCAWWAFNFVNNWAVLRWDMMYEDIAAKRDAIEGEFFANQEKVEAEAVALYEKDPTAGREYITKYVNDSMNKVNDEWWDFAWELVGKYADGQVVEGDGYSSPGYPMEYLEEVGMGATALADHKAAMGITDEKPADEGDKAPAEQEDNTNKEPVNEVKNPETESSNTTAIIIGVVAAVVVVAVAAVIFMKKGSNKNNGKNKK